MLAADLMSCPLAVVRAETPAREARLLAVDTGVEVLPVINAEGHLIGVVRGNSLQDGYSPPDESGTVADVMISPAISSGSHATVGELARVMLAHQLKVLPIVEDGRLVGLVDRNDLLRTLVYDDDVIISAVRSLLLDHAGLRRWGVHVIAGVVTVSGVFVDRADRTVVEAVVRTVPGVVAVRLRREHPLATGSA